MTTAPAPVAATQLRPAANRRHSTAPRATSNYQPLVLAVAVVVAGIIVDRLWPASPTVWWCATAGLLLIWLVLWIVGQHLLSSLSLLLALATAGGALHHHQWRLFPSDDVSACVGEVPGPLAVKVRLATGPRRLAAPPFDPMRVMQGGEQTRFDVHVLAVRDRQTWRPASGATSLIVDGHHFSPGAGDQLLVFAQAGRMRPPGNPGEVDFAAHARADRRLVWLRAEFPDCATIVQRGSGWSVAALIDGIKCRSDQQLWHYLDHDRSGFASALLLGDRGQLEIGRTEAFFHTNTIHFLAISGLHVMILAWSLMFGLRAGFLPRAATLLCVALATVLYTLLTDSPPSAVRSMILVLLICMAMGLGRPALAFNCLGASGLFVLWLNPCDLFRIGPQLSFLAVGTLAWFGPRWLKWHERDALARLIDRTRPWPMRAAAWLGRWSLRATAVTATVWAVTLPLVVEQFHLVSPIAIVISPLISLPMAVALLSGFGVMLCGWLLPPLAVPLALVCDGSLWLIDVMVIAASRIPGAYFWVSGPETWWVATFYLGLLLWAALQSWRPGLRWSLAALAIWAGLGLGISGISHRPAEKLECTFLSVGHGCCAVVKLPDGRTLMYDAGRLNSPYGGARSAAGFLWSRGIHRIDTLVISHADLDHYNAVPRLLEQFPVGEVFVTPVTFGEDSLPLHLLQQSIEYHGVPLRELWDGQQLSSPASCRISVLHPPRSGTSGSDNSNSIVLLIEYQGKRILLTGDLEPPGLTDLLLQDRLDCDVVLAPHHGSTRSDPPGLAAWSHPEWVVISGGHPEQSGPVTAAYEEFGATVLHTATHGAVTFVIEGGEVKATWHNQAGGWRP